MIDMRGFVFLLFAFWRIFYILSFYRRVRERQKYDL